MRHEDHVDKVDKGRNRATKTSVFGEVAVNLYFFCSGQFPDEKTVSMNGHASFGDCLPPSLPPSCPQSILLFLFFPARRRAAAAAEIYAMYASARTTRTSQVRWWALGAAAALGRRRGETCAKLTHARALCCDFLNAFQTLFCDIFVKEQYLQ